MPAVTVIAVISVSIASSRRAFAYAKRDGILRANVHMVDSE
jgi:hypothetical protein